MRIAFLGKGGSGKSTLAYRMTEYLSDQGFSVLAVDADHNMDLSYNLCGNFTGPFLGEAREEIKSYDEKKFRLNPPDPFTDKYAKSIKDRVRLIVAGPHTEDVLQGKKCSHSLSSPLKRYFPRLELGEKESVVVDEKAGSDGAGTGVLIGFDHVFIVTEPTIHSVKAAHQISEIAEYFKIPFSFVVNKAQDDNREMSGIHLKKDPVWLFPFDKELAQTKKEIGYHKKGFEILLKTARS